MYGQMVKFLEENESIFSDIKTKMSEYFEELNSIKKKLNKYVHKQGFQTFYISRNHPLNQANNQEKFIAEFEIYLQKCIGAVAIFRLTIDPFPILLSDNDMYSRTGDMMTKSYSDDFISKYIGTKYIDSYKTTDLYLNHYEWIIQEEAKNPYVSDVVKHQFIDKENIDEILNQKHLLSNHDLVAVILCGFSEKVVKIYCLGGLQMYFTNLDTKRKKMSWSGLDFKNFEVNSEKYNQLYDEAFISCLILDNESYFLEHNEILEKKEIEYLETLKTTHNNV